MCADLLPLMTLATMSFGFSDVPHLMLFSKLDTAGSLLGNDRCVP